MHVLLLLALFVVALASASVHRNRGMAQKRIRVAVMGPTGSGKSSFIKTVTGRNDIIIGHDLCSSTKEVMSYDFEHEGISFTLVDTPGFDDTEGIDTEVVQNILQWLQSSDPHHQRLNGLMYFHRIIDPRLTGSARENMRLFKDLCGEENMPNVLLATTFWDQIEASTGNIRENILRTDQQFWAPMVKKGSKVVRVLHDRETKLQLLVNIAKHNQPVLVQAQKEMMSGTSLEETAAAKRFGLDEVARLERENATRLDNERQRLRDLIDAQARSQIEQRQRLEAERTAYEREQEQSRRQKALQEEQRRRRWEQTEAEEQRVRQLEIDRLRKETELQQQARREAEQRRIWEAKVCQSFPRKRQICNWCRDRLDGDGVKGFTAPWAWRKYRPPSM